MKMESRGDVPFAASGKLAKRNAENGNLPVRRGTDQHRNDKGALRMMFGMRVRGGLLAASIMLAVPAAAALAVVLVSAPAAAQMVASVAVEGNRRVGVEALCSSFWPGPGGRLRPGPMPYGLQ